jgi:OOP family OmpA-OmpF porin
MKKFTSALWLALLAAPMFSAQAAQTFGPAWQSPAAAASDQVLIIYYRPADLVGNGPAHIYVDGEYQA